MQITQSRESHKTTTARQRFGHIHNPVMKPTSQYALTAGALALPLFITACSSTSVSRIDDPAYPSAIVRVEGRVNDTSPDMKQFAIATETRHTVNENVEEELFESVREALEEKGYDYVDNADSADIVVFVNYGFAPTIADTFDSRDLRVVEKQVDVTRTTDPVDPTQETVTTTTTRTVTADPHSRSGLYASYVDLVAYDQQSLKKDVVWATHLEGLGWKLHPAHDLPNLVKSARRLIATTTEPVNVTLN
jgi:hypothetical protein